MKGPRIWTLDIETLPITGHVWKLFDNTVGLNQIVEDWAIMSFAAKKLGQKKVIYHDTSKALGGPRADRDMIATLIAVLDSADIVVGHNFRRFDMRKIKARAVQHKLPPFREPIIIDTLELAKQAGAFTSNKLEYLADRLTDQKKDSHGKYPGHAMWQAILQGDMKAWKENKRYNKQDVVANEALYLEIRPYAHGATSLATYYRDPAWRCPACGSKHTVSAGLHLGQHLRYSRHACTDCGAYSRNRYHTGSPSAQKGLLR